MKAAYSPSQLLPPSTAAAMPRAQAQQNRVYSITTFCTTVPCPSQTLRTPLQLPAAGNMTSQHQHQQQQQHHTQPQAYAAAAAPAALIRSCPYSNQQPPLGAVTAALAVQMTGSTYLYMVLCLLLHHRTSRRYSETGRVVATHCRWL